MTFRLIVLMLTLPFVICAALAADLVVPRREELEIGRLVECLRQLERGKSTGLGGEWCISEGVWRDRTRAAYIHSKDPYFCRQVAVKQVRWIMDNLRRKGIEPTAKRVGHCWRWGLTSFLEGRLDPESYGQRLENLMASK